MAPFPRLFALVTALLLGAGVTPGSAQEDISLPGFGPPEEDPAGALLEGPEAEVFLGTVRAIRDYGLDSVSDSVLWEMAIEGLVDALDDPYAQVLSPEEVAEFQEQSTGNYAGIGIQITELEGAVTVTAVFRGTPAEEAGLQVGDRIVGVDDEEFDDWSVDDVSNRVRGEPGTEVEVRVRRQGIERPLRHVIVRDRVHVPAVNAEVIFDDVGYIGLDRFTRTAASEVDSVLTHLEERGAEGLIVDLRRNPGGYMDEALSMADLFLEEGSGLVRTRTRVPGEGSDIREDSAYARRGAKVGDRPVVILVDRYTASAAEIVAGALQDYDRALIVGERTFGKGAVQTVLPLPNDRRMRITTGEWSTPLGRSLKRPVDSDGDVREEDRQELPTFTSRGGRELLGGGGVFPHLEVQPDTLTEREQEFVSAVADAEVALIPLIQEAAFAEAQRIRDADAPEEVRDEALEELQSDLAAEGIHPDLLEDPEVQNYLAWQVRVTFFERLEREGRAVEARASRDPVLREALDRLSGAGNNDELFAGYDADGEANVDEGAQTSARH